MNIKSILVIGAGTMGRGIAQWFCQNGVDVQLIDQNQAHLEQAKEKIYNSWEKLLAKKKFAPTEITEFHRALSLTTLHQIDQDTDLVVEAIVEDLGIKKSLFAELESIVSENCILASNTSSFPIAALSGELKHKERFIGLHFFNPATIMKLVEIIPAGWTDQTMLQNLYHWFEARGKVPAISSDTPGFIVNRVARNFYGESLRIQANPNSDNFKEIDRVMKSVGGFKMGPFELMDLIGIDINFAVTKSVWEAYFGEARFQPHPIQKNKVDSGQLGRKTGRGFYEY